MIFFISQQPYFKYLTLSNNCEDVKSRVSIVGANCFGRARGRNQEIKISRFSRICFQAIQIWNKMLRTSFVFFVSYSPGLVCCCCCCCCCCLFIYLFILHRLIEYTSVQYSIKLYKKANQSRWINNWLKLNKWNEEFYVIYTIFTIKPQVLQLHVEPLSYQALKVLRFSADFSSSG